MKEVIDEFFGSDPNAQDIIYISVPSENVGKRGVIRLKDFCFKFVRADIGGKTTSKKSMVKTMLLRILEGECSSANKD